MPALRQAAGKRAASRPLTAPQGAASGGDGGHVYPPLTEAQQRSTGSTLYSGTSEMQRNIIARWLGL